jgi:hypothetical protein
MEQGENSWFAAALEELGPKERTVLGAAAPGEGVVDHLVRIARGSRRAEARRTAMVALMPAARDRSPCAVKVALDLIQDASKLVRFEACRALAVALDPATLPALQEASDQGIDVPWNGLQCAIRAIRNGSRDAFHEGPGCTRWVLQDEEWDHKAQVTKVVGSSAYGTKPR